MAWYLALLALFPLVRSAAEQMRPQTASLDCDRPAADDVVTLERCVTVRPGDLELMADLGRAYERSGRWDRAEAVYRQALAIDPDDGDIRVRLGHALLRRGDADGARREGSAALVLQPGRRSPLDLIGLAASGPPHETGR